MNCYFTYQKLSKLSKTCLLRRQKLHWPRLILATRYCIWLVMFYFIIKFITLFYVALPLRGYITHCTRLPLCPVPVYNSRTKSCIWSFEQKVSRFICNSPTSFEVLQKVKVTSLRMLRHRICHNFYVNAYTSSSLTSIFKTNIVWKRNWALKLSISTRLIHDLEMHFCSFFLILCCINVLNNNNNSNNK